MGITLSGAGDDRHADDRAGDRPRVLLRLLADDAAAAPRWLALTAAVPVALAADTVSIAVMEFVDNVVLLLIPGAMEAGLDDLLY